MIESCPYETIVAALGGMRDRPDRSHVLSSINVPATVLVGELDTVTPPSDSEAMAADLPQAELVTIPGAGHLTPIEQPQAVNDALARLLQRS